MGYFMKRLFLFAGYDRDGIVDDSLLWYLKSLSGLGDIVFVMDNDATDVEIEKVRQIPNVLYANAVRHGEYDFGSYKRAYIWARDNKLLEKMFINIERKEDKLVFKGFVEHEYDLYFYCNYRYFVGITILCNEDYGCCRSFQKMRG